MPCKHSGIWIPIDEFIDHSQLQVHTLHGSLSYSFFSTELLYFERIFKNILITIYAILLEKKR